MVLVFAEGSLAEPRNPICQFRAVATPVTAYFSDTLAATGSPGLKPSGFRVHCSQQLVQ
jgi:hypothetical protein